MSTAIDAAFADESPDTAATDAPATDDAPADAPMDAATAAPVAAPTPAAPRAHETARELLRAKHDANKAKDELAALRKEVEDIKSRAGVTDSQVAVWKANPMKAMRELGISYSELTQAIAKGEAPEVPQTRADVQVAALQAELSKLTGDYEARTAAEAKAATDANLSRINGEATSYVKANAAQFPLVADFGFDAVREAESYFSETGEAAESYEVLAARAEARAIKDLEKQLPRLLKNPATAALISKLTNQALDTEAPDDGATATAPNQPAAHVARRATLTSKAAAAASSSRGNSQRTKLPWGNPHASSAVDDALR